MLNHRIHRQSSATACPPPLALTKERPFAHDNSLDQPVKNVDDENYVVIVNNHDAASVKKLG